MKRYILFICYILNACIAFAQSSSTPALKTPDSAFLAPPKKISASDLKVTEGTSMLPANDIAVNIARSKELGLFFNAIQLSVLNETFKSRGPITLFVPDDTAFGIVKGKLDTLRMPARKYDLIALITYHAVAGKITARHIAREIASNKGTATFTTLSGSKLRAMIDASRNIILVDENGGQSTINKANIEQNNGLVHIISSVLIPKFKAL